MCCSLVGIGRTIGCLLFLPLTAVKAEKCSATGIAARFGLHVAQKSAFRLMRNGGFQHADIGLRHAGSAPQRSAPFFLPAATTTTPVRHRLQCADIERVTSSSVIACSSSRPHIVCSGSVRAPWGVLSKGCAAFVTAGWQCRTCGRAAPGGLRRNLADGADTGNAGVPDHRNGRSGQWRAHCAAS